MNTPTITPRRLPDVAHDAAALARPLDWVGMSNIALPLRVAGHAGGEAIQVAASVAVAVDLVDRRECRPPARHAIPYGGSVTSTSASSHAVISRQSPWYSVTRSSW